MPLNGYSRLKLFEESIAIQSATIKTLRTLS